MSRVRSGRALAPWAGSIAGFAAWAVAQQASTLLVGRSCAAGWAWPVLAVCIVAIVVAGLGLAVSWRIRREGSVPDAEPGAGSRRFIAALSMGLAAIFILAILAQILAAAMLSGCER